MTTDIRAESVALLAEALSLDAGMEQTDEERDQRNEWWYRPSELAGRLLDASPTLARRLAFATAWEMAEAECKRLGFKGPDLMHHEDYTGRLSWIADAGYAPEGVREWGDTPTDALIALAEALRERAR